MLLIQWHRSRDPLIGKSPSSWTCGQPLIGGWLDHVGDPHVAAAAQVESGTTAKLWSAKVSISSSSSRAHLRNANRLECLQYDLPEINRYKKRSHQDDQHFIPFSLNSMTSRNLYLPLLVVNKVGTNHPGNYSEIPQSGWAIRYQQTFTTLRSTGQRTLMGCRNTRFSPSWIYLNIFIIVAIYCRSHPSASRGLTSVSWDYLVRFRCSKF